MNAWNETYTTVLTRSRLQRWREVFKFTFFPLKIACGEGACACVAAGRLPARGPPPALPHSHRHALREKGSRRAPQLPPGVRPCPVLRSPLKSKSQKDGDGDTSPGTALASQGRRRRSLETSRNTEGKPPPFCSHDRLGRSPEAGKCHGCLSLCLLSLQIEDKPSDGPMLRPCQGPAGSTIYTPWLKNSTWKCLCYKVLVEKKTNSASVKTSKNCFPQCRSRIYICWIRLLIR